MSVWKIPLSELEYGREEYNAVLNVLKSEWLSMGEKTAQFEKNFAEYLNCKYALAMSNCTTALHVAMRCCGIQEGDEVILPALTFVATSNAVLYCGGTPIFADIISPLNPTISPEDIERKITSKTRAIAVVHYAGYPCEMDKILKIAKKHSLKVIEDAAHSVGVHYKGKMLGAIGDCGCFSFFANKNLVTGEGGMFTTNNEKIYNYAKLIRAHGLTSLTWQRHHEKEFKGYDIVELGYNYRPTEIMAALGIEQLKKIDRINADRKKIVEYYKEYLSPIKGIEIPFGEYTGESAYHIFPLLVSNKDDRKILINYLNNAGIQTSYHYYPIHKFTFYKKMLGKNAPKLPITEDYSDREITLPLHQKMKKKDVIYIAKTINEFFKNN